jgi:predicted MFS family arabinose efflux permease
VAAALAVRMRHLSDPRGGTVTFDSRNYLALLRYRPAMLLLGVTVVEGILLPGAFPFVAPYLVARFDLSYLTVGLILSCFGVGALGYTWYAAGLLARLGEPGLVLAGGFLVAATILAAVELDNWLLFIPVPLALGLGYFMLHSVMQTRATELLPEARATAVSLFIFALFLGQGLGALLMGGAIALWGYRTAFQIDAAAMMLMTVWLAHYMRRHRIAGA